MIIDSFPENEFMNEMLNIFQSDCDSINYHLNATYNFDYIKNVYNLFLPNLLSNVDIVDKDQVVHTNYKFDPKIYKKEDSIRKNQTSNNKKKEKEIINN